MNTSEGKTDRDSGEAVTDFQGTDLAREFRYKSGISAKRLLRCERVNEITFKITDGEMSRVPAKKGWWGGYNATRPLASVFNVGITSAAWLARCGDKVCGPLPFAEAKAGGDEFGKGG
jgi:hypothetical protein